MTTTIATESDRAEWQARDATPTEALNAWTERAAKLEAENAKLRRERREPQPVTLDDAYAAIRETVEENKRLSAEVKELRRGPAGTIAEAIDLIRDQARDSEGVIDTVRRLIESQSRPASPRILAAIEGQARDGETPDQTVERIIRERDELRAERATWDSVEKERKKLATRVAELRDERERLRDALARIAAYLGVTDAANTTAIVEGAAAAREELDEARLLGHAPGLVIAIQTAVPAIRDGLNAGGSHAPEAVQARNEARDSLHALEAAAEGQAAPAAVLSAAELEVVRGVLHAAERYERGVLIDGLDYETKRWIEAGRPLASEGKEG